MAKKQKNKFTAQGQLSNGGTLIFGDTKTTSCHSVGYAQHNLRAKNQLAPENDSL